MVKMKERGKGRSICPSMEVRIVSEEGTIGCRKLKEQDGLENLRTLIKK